MTQKGKEAYLMMAIMLNGTLCGCMYHGIYSVYPLYAKEQFGDQIMVKDVSIALSSFFLATVFLSPFYVWLFPIVGRRRSIVFGMTLMMLCNIGLANLTMIPKDDPRKFKWLTFLLRFF